jgi:hypothetical protein
MSGPPGAGKTLLVRCAPTILPNMVIEEMREVTKIYSIAGMLPPGKPLIHISLSAPCIILFRMWALWGRTHTTPRCRSRLQPTIVVV